MNRAGAAGRPPQTALVDEIIAPLHFADDPMQQARSDHFVLAKLRRDVLKQGIAVGLRYGFSGLHQPVEIREREGAIAVDREVSRQPPHRKNKNGATGLWFRLQSFPFSRMPRRDSARASGAIFSPSRLRFLGCRAFEGKGAIKWTRLSCRTFAANAVRLQRHALAYNLGNFLRILATPEPIKDWSLTSLKEKLIKIGAKVVSHGRYVAFQMAEAAIRAATVPGDIAAHRNNCGRSHHRRRHGTTDGHVFRDNRREDCVQMPRKMDTSRGSRAVWAPGTAPVVGMGAPLLRKGGKA